MKKETKKIKPSPSKLDSTSETFFYSFIGENVNITMFLTNAVDEKNDGTITINGYLLDIDETHFYLGDSDEEVTTALTKPKHYIIELAHEENEYTEILEKMEIPKDDKKN